MVNLKEITEVLKKLENNLERLNYLKKILEEVEDKNLKQNIKDLMKDIRELEAVTQIETKGKVEWSLPEEEQPVEERRLETQVINIPVGRKEEEEEKIKYGVSHSGITYAPDKLGNEYIHSKIVDSLRSESMGFNENLPLMEDQKNLIEEKVRQYMPTATEERIQEETSSVLRNFQYQTAHDDQKTYASVSHEVHDKAKKKTIH
tara:strand:- start:381 stop:992 length:612 start_codon:yes stop_codon:yes gene_type:complete